MGLAEEMLKRCDVLSLELAQKEARIRELEDILVSIQGVIINNDNVRVQAKHIGSDLAVHLIFERIEKALSEKSDKEDGGEIPR